MSPITEAVLTVEAFQGKDAAATLLVELIKELTRVYQMRESSNR